MLKVGSTYPWDGRPQDFTQYGQVNIICIVAPTTPYTIQTGTGVDFITRLAEYDNGSSITLTSTISGVGTYTVPGNSYLALTGGTNGTFYVGGTQTALPGTRVVGSGGGGGGGGGAVTVADGADVALGAKADTAYAGTGIASVVSVLKGIYSQLVAPLPTGTNAIGSVSVSNLPATQAVSATALPLPAGAATAANQATANTSLAAISGTSYKAVAASQTAVVLGATGATGDILNGLLITPLTTSPGAVSVQDGSGSAMTLFVGGTSSVSSLVPFSAFVGAKSTSGAWKVTTGANVSVVAMGSFT